eukprot:196482-Prymnesium_polylepis.1
MVTNVLVVVLPHGFREHHSLHEQYRPQQHAIGRVVLRPAGERTLVAKAAREDVERHVLWTAEGHVGDTTAHTHTHTQAHGGEHARSHRKLA